MFSLTSRCQFSEGAARDSPGAGGVPQPPFRMAPVGTVEEPPLHLHCPGLHVPRAARAPTGSWRPGQADEHPLHCFFLFHFEEHMMRLTMRPVHALASPLTRPVCPSHICQVPCSAHSLP